MEFMENFDFNAPADVFVGGGRINRRKAMSYRRFQTGAEAIRFAIELQAADKLVATVVEIDETRFAAEEIRTLYDSAEYPLPRRQTS